MALYWFGIMWISWPLSHNTIILGSLRINGVSYGSSILTLVVLTSWVSDVAGYYCKYYKDTLNFY